MSKYHINARGNAAVCGAQHGRCPFGSSEDHYSNAEDAQMAYEKRMSDGLFSKQNKNTKFESYPGSTPTSPNEKRSEELKKIGVSDRAFVIREQLSKMAIKEGIEKGRPSQELLTKIKIAARIYEASKDLSYDPQMVENSYASSNGSLEKQMTELPKRPIMFIGEEDRKRLSQILVWQSIKDGEHEAQKEALEK